MNNVYGLGGIAGQATVYSNHVYDNSYGKLSAIPFKLAKSSLLTSSGESGHFVRDTPTTVKDHEGVVRGVLNNEIRRQGQRRVHNGYADGSANTEDLTTLIKLTSLNDITTATTIELTSANNSYCYFNSPNNYPVGSKIVVRVKVQWISGATNVGFRFTEAGAASDLEAVVDLSDGLEHVVTLNLTMTTNALAQFGIDNRGAVVTGVQQAATKILFTELQIQDKTGASDPTVPDSYVSTGVGVGSELVIDGGLNEVSDFDSWTEQNVVESLDVDRLKLTSTSTSTLITQQTISTIIGKEYTYSITMEADAGNSVAQSASMTLSNTSPAINTAVNTNGVEITKTGTFIATDTTSVISLRVASVAVWGADGDIAYFKDVTIKSLSHGSNVDGVKTFLTDNGNSVTDNVVTEAQGISLEDTRKVLNFTGSEYGVLETPITFSADFEIEIEATIPDATVNPFQVLVGSSDTNDFITAKDDGDIQVSLAGTSPASATPTGVTPFDGKIHTWILTRVGTAATLKIDGVTQISFTVSTSDSDWSILASNTAFANTMAGQILSTKFTDNSNLIADGTEIAINGENITSTDNWGGPRGVSTLSAVGGNFRSTSVNTATFGATLQVDDLIVGAAYIYEYSVLEGTAVGSNIILRYDSAASLNSGVGQLTVTEDAAGSITLIATATTMYFGAIVTGHAAGEYIEFSKISIQEAIARPEDITDYVFDSGSDLYELAEDESLGAELSGDAGLNNESYWDTVNAAITFDGDGVDINYSGVNAGMLKRHASGEPLTVGETVLVTLIISEYTSGYLYVFAGNTQVDTVSGIGIHTSLGVVATDGRLQINSDSFVGRVTQLSYNKLPDTACLLTGVVSGDWYDYSQARINAGIISDFKVTKGLPIGDFLEPGSTNKCTNYNANPDSGLLAMGSAAAFNAAVTNVTVTDGGAGALWGVVDGAAAIEAAGLSAICTDNLLIKVDNISGSGFAYTTFNQFTGNTNIHSISCWVMVESGSNADLRLDDGAGEVNITNTVLTRIKSENITPLGTTAKCQVRVPAGSVAYFIVNQMEQKAFVTSEITTEGSNNTRDADELDYSSDAVPVINFTPSVTWTPTAENQGNMYIWSSYTDANNWTAIWHDGTYLYATKRVNGINNSSYIELAYTINISYKIKAAFLDSGTSISVDGVFGVDDDRIKDAVIASNMEIGALNKLSQQTGGIQDFLIEEKSSSGVIQERFIPTFAGSQHGVIDTPITFTGDFEVEVEYSTTSLTANMALYADTASAHSYLTISPGSYGIGVGGIAYFIGVANLNDGKIHKVKLTHIGGVTELFHDGALVDSRFTIVNPSASINFLGKGTGASNYFEGQILSEKFTDAGTVVANYVFDSGSDSYQLPQGADYGDELVVNGTFDSDTSNWTPNRSGVLTNVDSHMRVTNGAITYGYGFQGMTVVIGKTYVVEVDFKYKGFFGDYRVGTVIEGADYHRTSNLSEDQTVSFTFVATSTALYLNLFVQGGVPGDYTEWDNVTVRQLPDNNCILTNFATTDWNLYTRYKNLVHDGGEIAEAWVGDNIVVNGGFGTDTAWVKGDGWTIENGIASQDGTGGDYTVLRQAELPIVDGQIYLTKFNITDIFGHATLAINDQLVRSGGWYGTDQGVGLITLVQTALNSSTLKRFGTLGTGAGGSLDDVSTQHLLEVL